jgi:hypothetical protein
MTIRFALPQHRLERSIRALIGPAQLDLIGKIFREIPEILRLDGAEGGFGGSAAEVLGGFDPLGSLLQQPDRGGVLGDAGVRNVAQADDRRRLFGEPAAEGGERQPFAAPVQGAVLERLLPPGPHPQHGLVAEAGQLVASPAVLEMDLDASELRQPLPQGGEEGGIDRQLVLVHVAGVHLLAQPGERCRGIGLEQLQRGVERCEERQAAQVAQEDGAAGTHQLGGARHHLGQIIGAREVLRHRVDAGRTRAAGRGPWAPAGWERAARAPRGARRRCAPRAP